jgi:catechol 2,3-dioxygenase-like lactoylglutathione lyase family enzyme
MKLKRKIAVVSLWAENVEEAAHFYRDVLELTLMKEHHGGRPHFDLGDSVLTLLEGKSAAATQTTVERFPLLAFETDDIEAAKQHLEAQDVDLPWGLEADHYSKWVMFSDPAGNLIEIAEFD